MNKAYILTYDKGGLFEAFNYEEFHKKLTTAKGIITWWHYLQCSYILIVKANVPAANITAYVRQLMPKKNFFVCEVDISNHNGYLPQEAWDWLKQQSLHTKLPW